MENLHVDFISSVFLEFFQFIDYSLDLYHEFTIFLWLSNRVFSFQNNPKNLDLSYKTDLDLWDCLGRVKLVL